MRVRDAERYHDDDQGAGPTSVAQGWLRHVYVLAGAEIFRRSAHATDPATTVSRSFRENFSKTLARKFFRKTDLVDAINLVQKSSKSELSSRFLSRSKFWGAKKIEFSKGRLPPEDGSVRPQTLGKRVSDDPRHFMFRRRKKIRQKFFKKDFVGSLSWKGAGSHQTLVGQTFGLTGEG